MSSLNREASERFNAIKKLNPGMTTNQALVASGAGSMVDLNNQLYNTGVSSRNVPAYSPERQIPPPPPPPNYDRRLPPSVMEQMLLTGGFVNQYDQDTGNYLYGPADNIQYFDNPAEYSAAVSGRNQPEPEQERERYESDMGTEVPERRSPPMETPGSRDRDVPPGSSSPERSTPLPRDNDPKGSVYNRSLFKSAQTRPARNKLEKMAGIRGLNPEPPGPRIRQEFNPNIDPATGQPYGPGDPNGPGYKNSLPPAPINPNINPATGRPYDPGIQTVLFIKMVQQQASLMGWVIQPILITKIRLGLAEQMDLTQQQASLICRVIQTVLFIKVRLGLAEQMDLTQPATGQASRVIQKVSVALTHGYLL